MKELLTYIARSMVSSPEEVSVTEVERDGELVLELRVAQKDMGKIIGRQGRTSKEIRAIIKAASASEPRKVSVDILD